MFKSNLWRDLTLMQSCTLDPASFLRMRIVAWAVRLAVDHQIPVSTIIMPPVRWDTHFRQKAVVIPRSPVQLWLKLPETRAPRPFLRVPGEPYVPKPPA